MLLIDKKISGNERGQQFYYNAFDIGLIILLLSILSISSPLFLITSYISITWGKRESVFCIHVTLDVALRSYFC